MKDALGRVQTVLVLGAGSDIGMATARVLAGEGATTFVLAARKPDEMQRHAEELRGLGASEVRAVEFNVDAVQAHRRFATDVFADAGDVDLVLMTAGVLGDQQASEGSSELTEATLHTNFVGPAVLLLRVAELLRAQGHGTIVVLSSVSAERGRKSNFVYGSSKAGLDTFSQGLGDRLAGSGVRVMIVRPGFVRTKMTAGLKPAPLSTTAPATARAIVEGLHRDADIVWVPQPLRWVMLGLRLLPRSVFRRLPI
jgi:decaprenylphospho-beta-D-erythro-pentofuranosid-2-ulose 2-reductase